MPLGPVVGQVGSGVGHDRDVPPRSDEEEGSEGADQEEVTRVVLGVSFTNTGPIRVDLLRTESVLSVRLLVTREHVAQRIREDAEELAGRLGDGVLWYAMLAALPMTVTRSRLPFTLTRSTQKPLDSLWKVTRSTEPCSRSA